VSPEIGVTYDPAMKVSGEPGGKKHELELAEKIGTEEK